MALRLGVIGTGSVVREIYEYLYFRSRYSPAIRVEAICDSDASQLRSCGERWDIPDGRRFLDYETMLEAVDLDAVAVNTPDDAHRAPVEAAVRAGVDVVLPKPTAGTVCDAHAIVEAVRESGRFVGVDFHKREDPVTKEARSRYASGAYGTLQAAQFQMLDKLLVSDPNHSPRFFASEDFARRNSPVSFLTSHMADAFMFVTGLRPVEVRAIGYSQKLPSLEPIAVAGYDLVDTTVLFERGVICHIVTGWTLPNAADCLTVQTGRLLFTDGMVDLWQNHYGYREVTTSGIDNRNVLFRNFEPGGRVSGYGIDCPGRILENIGRFRSGVMETDELTDLLSPSTLGFYTTLLCECASVSLERGSRPESGVVAGALVDVQTLLADRLGQEAARSYYR